MTASSILLANPIAHLFVGYDAELCDMTVNALRIYALSFLVCGFNIFGSAFFTGLNNGTASALISFLRTLVIQVAAVLLLPKLLGINGIWLAITVAEALTLLVTEASDGKNTTTHKADHPNSRGGSNHRGCACAF